MARTLSEKVGRGKCPTCGEAVTYRRSSGGMLTHKCDSCDSSGYAEPNGKAYRQRMATIITEDEPSKPEPAKAEPPEAAPADTKKQKKSFSLEDL